MACKLCSQGISLASSLRSLWINRNVVFIPVRHKMRNKQKKKLPHIPKEAKWKKSVKSLDQEKIIKSAQTEAWLSRKPTDDIWIRTYYPMVAHSFDDAVVMHREYADPAMLDNAEGVVYADMELDMSTTKKTKFMKVVSNTVSIPHRFAEGVPKRIAVFTKNEEDIKMAESLEVEFAGGSDLVEKIKNGEIEPSEFEFALCTPDAVVDIMALRSILKTKFPTKAKGNLGTDLKEMIEFHRTGVSYESILESEAIGKLQIPIGQLNMSVSDLQDNLQCLAQAVRKHRPPRLGSFITRLILIAPPSHERFLIQQACYGQEDRKKEEMEEKDSGSDSEHEDARDAQA